MKSETEVKQFLAFMYISEFVFIGTDLEHYIKTIQKILKWVIDEPTADNCGLKKSAKTTDKK